MRSDIGSGLVRILGTTQSPLLMACAGMIEGLATYKKKVYSEHIN
jgi:hypothetical protein